MNAPLIVGRIERLPIHQLKPYTKNPRTHSQAQIDQIAASIREFGFVSPLLVSIDNTIIAGHARLRAAQQLGMMEVPVIVLAHLSDAQRRALVIADNQLALNAGWDEQLLSLELAALRAGAFNLELVGFDAEVVESLLAEQGAPEGLRDPDAAPPVPATPVSLPNDLWVLGDHRLLCGDATLMKAIETVLGGGQPAMIFTDPPYAVQYQGKTPERLTIDNDALGEGFYDFLHAACRNMIGVCRGALYICMSSPELHTLHQAFTKAGGHWSTFLIWAKHHFALGRSDYQRQFEVILYGWPNGVDHYWCGARDQGDVWFIVRPVANRAHPTMKPIELVERAIHNSSRIGDTVLDPFAGSGTTLIACERQQRNARLIEIDPKYVDVICRRWEEFTGESAVLDGDGRTFRQIQQERHCQEAA